MVDQQEQLALLKEQYRRLERQDFYNEMSDNFYYTSGRRDRMRHQIKSLLESIRRIQPDWNPYKDDDPLNID